MNNWKKLAAAVILAGAVVMIQGCGGNGEEAKSKKHGKRQGMEGSHGSGLSALPLCG
ncbi:hypothetical protein [uncultured Dialister sp.]|uniref:hypothetical protein n=1 Tax=uncultured Dialister sp. TaxID=278064 RepID=UPI002659DDFF|nr:hypothetical protein [uncultured Dialister sp.]